jgi:hypothetical protein
MRRMAHTKKREHIQVGVAETKITVGKITNRVHVNMTLSIGQEKRLLKMLQQRSDRRGKR